jgi:hypothetical protein
MGRKHFVTRPDFHPWEDAAGYEALSSLFAGDLNAPPPTGGAGARQLEQTASRLLRTIPAHSHSPICWQHFFVLKALFSAPDFSAMVSLYLLNIDLNLMQIARARVCQDFDAMAWKADDISRIAENLGALAARDAAHRLKQASLAQDIAASYGFISELSQACHEAETALNGWLALNAAPDKA